MLGNAKEESLTWIVYASIAAVSLAAADSFVKLAANRISTGLGLLLYGGCTFLTGVGWVLWDYVQGAPQHARPSGFLCAVGVGVAFSSVTICLYKTFEASAPISVALPLIRVTGLFLAILLGIVVLREPLTMRYVIGFLLACAGLYLVVTR
jgi:bacterial/archaeal transporter family protein